MLYDSQESKDVVSDIFASLLQHGELPHEEKLQVGNDTSGLEVEGYLMTAVRNHCLDVLSNNSVRERMEKLFLTESMQNHIITMNDDDRMERLMQFIEAELPPLSQQIFRLRFLQKMSYEEMAQIAGVSKVMVYNHLSQSLLFV